VTGRLTVTSPDETGAALVVGDEGAVPAGSLVHVINATQDPAALQVSGLNQSSFPAVCSRAFHACVFAGEDGSFEITIGAENDHEIIVEILNGDGFRISERLHRPVPRNIRHFVRPVTDLGLMANIPMSDRKLYVLMPRTLDDPKGLVSVVDLAAGTRTPVTFDGPHPARMAVRTETREGIVVDPEGNFGAKIDLAANNFDAPPKFPLGSPRDVILDSSNNVILVSTAETVAPGGTAADARFIRSFNFNTLAEQDPIRVSFLQTAIPGATNVATRSLDLTPFNDGAITIDLAAFVGIYDISGTPTPIVGLFDASGMLFLTALPLPAGTDPEDVAFARTSDRILVSDSGNDRIHLIDFTYAAGVATLTAAGEIADPEGFLLNPRDITVHPDSGFAFVNAKNGTADRPDTVLTIDLTADQVVDINPVGFGPSGQAFDPVDQRLFVSTLKSRAVTFWGLPDLLP
jgi:DNA-binding beta-propeller fold protein YncE